jgi:hypothetical protein
MPLGSCPQQQISVQTPVSEKSAQEYLCAPRTHAADQRVTAAHFSQLAELYPPVLSPLGFRLFILWLMENERFS